MPIIFESNKYTIVFDNTRGCNNRSAKISADVFNNFFVVAQGRFSINIEAISTVFIDESLDFLFK